MKNLADSIISGKIARNSAKNALHEIVKTGNELDVVIKELDLGNVTDQLKLQEIISQEIGRAHV